MLTTWLTSNQRNNASGYKFAVTDVTEQSEVNESVLGYLAHVITTAHGSPKMIKHECRKLLQDAKGANLHIIEKYIEEEILSEDTCEVERQIIERYLEKEVLPAENRTMTRVAHFGEVLAARFLTEFEGFGLPIHKLRFREKKDWAPRLTDLCLIKTNASKPLVCYGEVKTNSSSCDKQLGVRGHGSLAKDDALSDPEILRFICNWLYEADKFEEADFISGIKLGLTAYDKRHDLFIVHDCDNWSDEILDNLNGHQLDPRLVNFSVKVILLSQLRHLIDSAYEQTWMAARDLVHE